MTDRAWAARQPSCFRHVRRLLDRSDDVNRRGRRQPFGTVHDLQGRIRRSQLSLVHERRGFRLTRQQHHCTTPEFDRCDLPWGLGRSDSADRRHSVLRGDRRVERVRHEPIDPDAVDTGSPERRHLHRRFDRRDDSHGSRRREPGRPGDHLRGAIRRRELELVHELRLVGLTDQHHHRAAARLLRPELPQRLRRPHRADGRHGVLRAGHRHQRIRSSRRRLHHLDGGNAPRRHLHPGLDRSDDRDRARRRQPRRPDHELRGGVRPRQLHLVHERRHDGLARQHHDSANPRLHRLDAPQRRRRPDRADRRQRILRRTDSDERLRRRRRLPGAVDTGASQRVHVSGRLDRRDDCGRGRKRQPDRADHDVRRAVRPRQLHLVHELRLLRLPGAHDHCAAPRLHRHEFPRGRRRPHWPGCGQPVLRAVDRHQRLWARQRRHRDVDGGPAQRHHDRRLLHEHLGPPPSTVP
jgi:hypothetical protein